MLKMQYTKEDYQRELNEFLKQLNAKAEKYGVFKSKDEEEREKKEKADRLGKTTDTYISYISRHDKAREMIEQLKANGYDLKFSTEMNSQYTDDAIIVNVSSKNPDDLPQDEVSDIVQIMDKLEITCKNCGKVFRIETLGTLYCPNCRPLMENKLGRTF